MVTPSQSRDTRGGRAPLRAVENILELVGGTPLLRLARFAPPPAAELFAKLEYMNPGGSVKDRAALGMILDAERRGVLEPGSTIIEPTAGNTGIGLALVGAARGYRVVLCVPEGYSREKMKIMEALGGRVEYVPAEEGMEGAVRRARELAAETPGSFIPQQFENPANPRFHRETTAREIIEQAEGRIDALVLGCGSAGTFTGLTHAVKEVNPKVYCVLVEPEGSILGGGSASSSRRTSTATRPTKSSPSRTRRLSPPCGSSRAPRASSAAARPARPPPPPGRSPNGSAQANASSHSSPTGRSGT
jgi:cysteine synthase A